MTEFPVIDVEPLVSGSDEIAAVGDAIDAACRDLGFFCIVGHGIDTALRERLDAAARAFFALADAEKAEIAMEHGGKAWRGWFPLGGELTSGAPDRKEGVYFGSERPGADGPLQGANLFPRRPAELRAVVLEYLDVMTALGHTLLRGMARGLGLDEQWFVRALTYDPTILFRIFRYPPDDGTAEWGVGEHTDYGLLTLLAQDATGGLQVHSADGWLDVPPRLDAFVCNLGDMLERMTGGRYRSTPHRVHNTSGTDRLSFPFFFDPSWDARVEPIPGCEVPVERDGARWDGADVHAFGETYGEYLLDKVAKVFPALRDEVL